MKGTLVTTLIASALLTAPALSRAQSTVEVPQSTVSTARTTASAASLGTQAAGVIGGVGLGVAAGLAVPNTGIANDATEMRQQQQAIDEQQQQQQPKHIDQEPEP
jgi:hypothetical protein